MYFSLSVSQNKYEYLEIGTMIYIYSIDTTNSLSHFVVRRKTCLLALLSRTTSGSTIVPLP